MQVEEPAQSKNQMTPDPIHLLAARAWMIPRENSPSGSNKPVQLWETVIYFRLKLTHLCVGSLGSITPKINKRHLFEHRPECCEDAAMLVSVVTGSVLTGEREGFNWSRNIIWTRKMSSANTSQVSAAQTSLGAPLFSLPGIALIAPQKPFSTWRLPHPKGLFLTVGREWF